ncbi:MAG: aromatic ring-hydroxylating dioxygenase subunit alpha [Burkholderiaceae bacterium]|nr:MAG: aromatic ring-hydroxylating dioxygenase subunit alpha [Burkholderiaceae bacterium]
MDMSAPKNFWYVAAFSDDIGHEIVARTILNQPLVMFRASDGKVAALEDRCPHRAVPLSLGRLVGDAVRCTYHGMQIGPDGSCVHIPCQDRIPAAAHARVFPIVEQYKMVWIWMGEPALADPAKVPDFHWMDDPEWATCTGYHYIKANYQLLNDNLLDLSHESYVHDDTIGNDAVAQAPVSSVVKDGTVRVSREILDCEPPPFYVKATGFTTNIDRWHTTVFLPPSFNVIENGSFPHGHTRSEALERRVMNLVTPETDVTSHYFWGIARAYQRDDEALTTYIREQIYRTFNQDKVVLEAQQRNLGPDSPSPFPVALRTDAGPIQARKLIDELLRNERKTAA